MERIQKENVRHSHGFVVSGVWRIKIEFLHFRLTQPSRIVSSIYIWTLRIHPCNPYMLYKHKYQNIIKCHIKREFMKIQEDYILTLIYKFNLI